MDEHVAAQRRQLQHRLLRGLRRGDLENVGDTVVGFDLAEERGGEGEEHGALLLRRVAVEPRGLEGVAAALLGGELGVAVPGDDGVAHALLVGEGDEVDALPGVLLVVHVDAEGRRVELDDGRGRVQHQRPVRRREDGGALRRETAQLLEEGREGRVEREGLEVPAREKRREAAHIVGGEVAGEWRVVVGVVPAPGLHAAVVVEEDPLHTLIVALADVVQHRLIV